MRILIISLLLLFTAACSGEDSAPNQHTGERDVADFDASEDAAETEDANQADTTARCTCHTTDACCDGCQPVNVGESCDDASECTLETTCQPDGTCGGSTGSPCDELLTEPQCQAASCDDVLGCTVQNTRQGLACEAEGIRDGRCDNGACKGTVCTCDVENECCDGCVSLNEGEACDDGNDATGLDSCRSGVCRGDACECSEGECCDGCHFLTRDTVCDDEPVSNERVCVPGSPEGFRYVFTHQACDGTSPVCGTHTTTKDGDISLCQSSATCYKHPQYGIGCYDN